MREDMLPAPMFALSFNTGASVSILDPSPRGETTVEETRIKKDILIDARYQFGAMKLWQTETHPINIGFEFPGTMNMLGFGPSATVKPRWIRRYHPITDGFSQQYEVQFPVWCE